MGELLAQLIPTAIVGALSPLPIIVVISLLQAKRGRPKAIGFTVGLVGVFVAIGVFALATSTVEEGTSEKGSAVTGTIIAAVGILLLVAALKQLLDAPDPDAPPPKLLAKLDTMSPAGAAALGAAMAVINVKQLGIYLAGVSLIVNADVPSGQRWLALALLIVIIQLAVIGAIAADVFAHEWATRVLGAFHRWLVRNNRVIGIVIGLVVGAWFTVKGVTQIVG